VDTKYFSGNLWAVITMNTSDDDNTVVAAKYDTSAHSWATVLGPGTQFRQIDTSYLPADVQTYLMQTNHVNLGD
jgi:allantoicase